MNQVLIRLFVLLLVILQLLLFFFFTEIHSREMASKSWLNFLTFLCGSAIGFFLCSQLFSILLKEQADIQPNMLHNDPHARHSDDTGHHHLKGQMNFNADSSQHKGTVCVSMK